MKEYQMNIRSMLLATALLGSLVTGTSAAELAGGAILSTPMNGHQLLTDTRGRALYVYDKDQAGLPTCAGFCAIGWPWMKAAKNAVAAGDFAPVAGRGGAIWAYKGRPLYLYAGDHKPGDVTGDGADGVWHAAIIR
jgi:predicted lipoprotein with Yx(FWY)xxD motif